MHETIRSAGAALRAKSRTAADLVEHSLAAIARHQARTNAFTLVDAEGARAAARSADAELESGCDRGPLHGIPISLKDIIDECGVVTTAGSRVLGGRIAERDATVRTRLREAGAIVIGRTNMHEFALGTTSEDSAFGPVRNPLDSERSAGGSSGGSAAAVATGMGLASVGSDTGGSIRIPAAACGIVGLKPSRGDVPTDGVIPLSQTLDHVGPLARTVADALLLHGVIAAADVHLEPIEPRAIRLRKLGGYFDSVEPAVGGAYRRALEALTQAGMTISTAEIGGADIISEAYANIVLPEAAHWHAPFLDSRAAEYSPAVHARLLHGRTISVTAYFDALDTCRTLRAAVDAALAGCDAIVLPTLPIVAPLLGATAMELGASVIPIRAAMLRHTQLFNLTGHPAISLPIPVDGLPVGLQLVGRRGRTADLGAVALVCERVLSEAQRAS
jgi:aspartyl-tRNA(Asn)/glutamyl-tRNA(Gln) amidotransferase subunit A